MSDQRDALRAAIEPLCREAARTNCLFGKQVLSPDEWEKRTPAERYTAVLSRMAFGAQNESEVGKLFAIGYTEPNALERIDAFLAQDKMRHVLVDIRYRAYSRWRPAFTQKALHERYGIQYAHSPHLGNINYATGGPIELADPEQGVYRVACLLQSGASVMLMCACKDYERCHRKVVYDLVMAELSKGVKA